VTIGANTIVAAGAVVSHDLPANVLAGGVPATVLRPLTATDRADWEAQRQAYFEVQGVTLRTAQPADLDAIMAIENAGFTPDEAATKASMQDRIAQYPDTFIVAVDHDQIIGYIVGPAYQERYLSDDLFGAAQPNLAADKAPYQTILSLAVAPQAQRRGLGGLLLAALQEIAEAQGRQAITLTCLQRLVPFYAANGYINEGVSASTHAGEQWFNMVLPLGTLA
jgi:ribosomal protein S18 acetylase RimI-like enzyme